ncbi:MAG: zf-HC2 domain-containing protein [Anaerolineales bacterium]
MMSPTNLPAEDLERLSAYIDGELSPVETAELEARLAREPDLRSELLELRSVVKATRSIPPRRLPRIFTLTPEMAGVRTGFRFPVLQLASAVSAVAFVILFSFDLIGSSVSAQRAALPVGEVQALEAPAEEPSALEYQAPEETTEEAMLGGGEAPSAAMLEQGAPTEGEAQAEAGALKYAGTPQPEVGEEMRAAADEALAMGTATLAQAGETENAVGEAALPTETEAWETASTAPEATPQVETHAETPVQELEQGPNLLRIGEITLASFSLIFAALSLILRRRTG